MRKNSHKIFLLNEVSSEDKNDQISLDFLKMIFPDFQKWLKHLIS
jgi:hypothetical protein